jgi:hypothetical protein
VLVGVKAWQVTDAASAIRPLVGPKTVVVPLQNGVEAASELAAALGSATLGGMCGTLSFVAAPGHIRSVGGQNFIKFGELDNEPRTGRTPAGMLLACESFSGGTRQHRQGVVGQVPDGDLIRWCGFDHESADWCDAGHSGDPQVAGAVPAGSAGGGESPRRTDGGYSSLRHDEIL